MFPCCSFAENGPRPLGVFGIAAGSRLQADDFLQNYQLVVTVQHRYVCPVMTCTLIGLDILSCIVSANHRLTKA